MAAWFYSDVQYNLDTYIDGHFSNTCTKFQSVRLFSLLAAQKSNLRNQHQKKYSEHVYEMHSSDTRLKMAKTTTKAHTKNYGNVKKSIHLNVLI